MMEHQPSTFSSVDPADDAELRDIRPVRSSDLPAPLAHDIGPAAAWLSTGLYLCVAGILFFAFAVGEGVLLGSIIFVVLAIGIGLVRVCIRLLPLPDEKSRQAESVKTCSGEVGRREATMQICMIPAALALAIALIAAVASLVR